MGATLPLLNTCLQPYPHTNPRKRDRTLCLRDQQCGDMDAVTVVYNHNGNALEHVFHGTHFPESSDTDDGQSTFAPSTFEMSPAPSRSSTPSPHSISAPSEIVPLIRNPNTLLAPSVLLRHNGQLYSPTIQRESSTYAAQLPNANYPSEQYQPVGLFSASFQLSQQQSQSRFALHSHPDPAIFLSSIYPIPTFSPPLVHEDHSSLLPGAFLHSERRPKASPLAQPVPHTQVQLQPLSRFIPPHPPRQLSLQPPPVAVNFQRSFSEIPTAGNWGGNMSFIPHQHKFAPPVRSGLLSQQFMSHNPSVTSEVEECEIDPFSQLSARTLALMDQPESEVTIYDCEYCEKTYQGKHARSIWRRHLSDKHKIPLATQPRRTRWDNDANRPKTEEERRERTLESKRRWARKNRAAKKAARENQRFGAATPLPSATRGVIRDADSRVSSPSHSVSVSPSSNSIPLPTLSSRSKETLSVPAPNSVRSQSLQVPGPHTRDCAHPMTRVCSVPLVTSSDPSTETPTSHQLSYDHSTSTTQFLPSDWSLQISTPIMTNAYNLQSFPQLQLGSSIRDRTTHEMMVPYNQHPLLKSQHFEPSGRPHTVDSQVLPTHAASFTPHQDLQPLYDVHAFAPKGQNLHVHHTPQVAHYGNPPLTWSPSMKLDSSFSGNNDAASNMQSSESKRPRFAQYLPLPASQVHDSIHTSSLPWGDASNDRSSYVTQSATKLSDRPSSSGLHTTEAGVHTEGSDQSSQASDVAFFDHTESRAIDAEEEVDKEELEEEDDAPICSAASSTRCSTSAGLPGGDASLSFGFSELDQQTPARPTGLRAMSRSAFVSPMNGDSVPGESGEDRQNGLGLFSSPMIGRPDADSSLYNGAFAPSSISKSGTQRHRATVCSSGGSISHWSTALQTPSDLSRHHSRKESFGGSGLMMSPSGPGGLFSSPQHPNLSKSLGLAPSGGDNLVGFLGSSWDLNH